MRPHGFTRLSRVAGSETTEENPLDAPTFPGVYIQEVPSGARTISGGATSVAAFVGRALRGPVNEPIAIANFDEFERVFGGLWVDSSLGYAVRDLAGKVLESLHSNQPALPHEATEDMASALEFEQASDEEGP